MEFAAKYKMPVNESVGAIRRRKLTDKLRCPDSQWTDRQNYYSVYLFCIVRSGNKNDRKIHQRKLSRLTLVMWI